MYKVIIEKTADDDIKKTEKIRRQEISGKSNIASRKSDYIVTGNKKHFLMSKILVRNGEEFLKDYWNKE